MRMKEKSGLTTGPDGPNITQHASAADFNQQLFTLGTIEVLGGATPTVSFASGRPPTTMIGPLRSDQAWRCPREP
jgi:hypothetical protein